MEQRLIRIVLEKLNRIHGNRKIKVSGFGRVRTSLLRAAVAQQTNLGKRYLDILTNKAVQHICSSKMTDEKAFEIAAITSTVWR